MKWISVKDRLPEHHDSILVCDNNKIGSNKKKCMGVAVFVDSIKMNETLWKSGYGNEAVDVKKHPYYFCSQEVKQHTYNNVTHWIPLPEPPKDKE